MSDIVEEMGGYLGDGSEFEALDSKASTTPGEHKTLRELAPLPPSTELDSDLEDLAIYIYEKSVNVYKAFMAGADEEPDKWSIEIQELITKQRIDELNLMLEEKRNLSEPWFVDIYIKERIQAHKKSLKALSQEGK